MDLSEMRDVLEAIECASLAELPGVLVANAALLALEGSPHPERLLQGDGDYILLAVAFDATTNIAFELIPVTLVDDRLRAALELITGRVFAGAADLREDQWDAAVLVMAAEAAEMPSATQHHAWAADEGSRITLAEIEQVWDRWNGTGVLAWSQLERRVTACYSYRRAM